MSLPGLWTAAQIRGPSTYVMLAPGLPDAYERPQLQHFFAHPNHGPRVFIKPTSIDFVRPAKDDDESFVAWQPERRDGTPMRHAESVPPARRDRLWAASPTATRHLMVSASVRKADVDYDGSAPAAVRIVAVVRVGGVTSTRKRVLAASDVDSFQIINAWAHWDLLPSIGSKALTPLRLLIAT